MWRVNRLRKFSSLVIAEHNNKTLKQGTLKSLSALQKLSPKPYSVFLAGHNIQPVVQQALKLPNVQKVFVYDDPKLEHKPGDLVASLISKLHSEQKFEVILGANTAEIKDVLPRVAALLDKDMIADITKVVSPNEVQRPVYAGAAIATVKLTATPKILSVRSSAFDQLPGEGKGEEVKGKVEGDSKEKWVSEEIVKSERPELTSAKIVVSGGRGVKSKEDFEKLVCKLADKLGAGVGATRAIVDSGLVSNDLQVGQTGKQVAPDLYIALGISGAIQHLAGMKDSKVIVAVNKDPEAPIFQVADIGLVGDIYKVVPELQNKL